MIGALIISEICLVLMSKGVPTWLGVVFSFGYCVSNVIALILWEETKDRIKLLENKTRKERR